MTERSLPPLPRAAIEGAATRPPKTLESLAIAVTVVAALYFGREVLVPLALAVLLSFALGPLVLFLRRWHFGRVPSVIATVVLAFLVIFGMGAVIGSQLAGLAANFPEYRATILHKIEAVRGTAASNGVVERASSMLQDLRSQIATLPPAAQPAGSAASARQIQQQTPIPVEIRQPEPAPLQIVEDIGTPLLQPLTAAAIVAIFVVFFLMKREDLRDRFIRLAGARDLQRTTLALDDAASRLSRYLLTQSAINASFGVVIGAGLWAIGVPNPVLWGVFAMLLRFVPYVGAMVAAAFPAALALAVDPGWSMVLWTLALFLIVEPITGQVAEPMLYGHSTGLSAVAIVVAAAFWTWLWGPIGLLLSTPLTMCLFVLGRHVDRLEFLDVMLGDQPPLAREESFYQRILAGDPDEAAYQAEEFLRDNPLSTYYDEVAVKALRLAQLDVDRGTLGHARRVEIKEAVDAVIDDLADHEDLVPPSRDEEMPPHPPLAPVLTEEELAPAWRDKPVMCIAGRGSLDEATAAMLVQILEKHGIGASVVPNAAVSPANLTRLDTAMRLACVCYIEPGNVMNARYLVRRLRRRAPHAKILLGLWTESDRLADRNLLHEIGADFLAISLRQAVDHIVEAARQAAQTTAETPSLDAAPLPAAS